MYNVLLAFKDSQAKSYTAVLTEGILFQKNQCSSWIPESVVELQKCSWIVNLPTPLKSVHIPSVLEVRAVTREPRTGSAAKMSRMLVSVSEACRRP